MIPGVILAGGASRRMGGADKALALLGGRSLITHVAARVAPQLSALAINAGGDPARFAATGLAVVPDAVPGGLGPLAGIHAAMLWAAGLGAARVLTVPVDCPFLPGDLAERLAAQRGIVLARSASGLHPTCGLWPTALAAPLAEALGGGARKLRVFAADHGATEVLFAGTDPDPFFNINAPDDLARAAAYV